MEPTLDYNSVPSGFAHCFNGACTCAGECLRYLVGGHVPADCNFVTAVNPVKAGVGGKSCPFFRPKKVVRLAVGMLHLYDNLNYQDALAVRHDLVRSLGRGIYYRIRNGERTISPGEQNFIRKIFRKYGIASEPQFDAYKETYEW